ncbi:MAG: 30S ribosomal protein S4 [Candidatus Methylomirabilis sp.]|nr:30S ribosomal protein S4 [Deltaproteobacteria bacterium]
MARYTDSVCRLCRREGLKLYLKGERCYGEKCAIERRPYPPGLHGQGRQKVSDYGMQLREKQKVRRLYGVLESQFRGYYHKATRTKGVTGQALLQHLELRLDNVVYRLGFAASRAEARQLVRHGHVTIDGRKVNVPSYEVRVGEAVAIRDKSKGKEKLVAKINKTLEALGSRVVPEWLQVDEQALAGKVLSPPQREHITMPISEQLIVELYSK